MNFSTLSHITSKILLITACAMCCCIPVALIYHEPMSPFFRSAILIGIPAGLIRIMKRGNRPESPGRHGAYLVVSLAWIILSLAGTLPYLLSKSIPGFTDALFESVSGFTTTGSSILTDIEILPKSILFWRSMTHWMGGIGIIVLVIVIMPSLNIGGYNLFTLESSLQEKIQPRIRSVGKRILLIYLMLTLLEILFLLAGGMNLFDSMCHAFGTVATGGFSTKNNSIAGYSPYIQYVVMLFMLLAGTNFLIHYYLVKREFTKIRKNEELWFYLSVIGIAGLVITASLYYRTGKNGEQAFRDSFFQVISIVTCTGFATADYQLWPSTAKILIFILLFAGGSTGSTAGGIKMARHLLALKNISMAFRKQIAPHAVLPLKINGKPVGPDDNNAILSFVQLYLLLFLSGGLALMLTGTDKMTAFSGIATAMGGIGPGFGSIGPVSNFAGLSRLAKLILSAFMLLGRLEIYTLLMLFTPWFWKK
ncbi:MAG: TrkH family potassium uptake protein [Mangrovibacterium sp.]